MKVIITAQELLDKGVWLEFCELVGINEYAVNEGLIDEDHEFDLTKEQAKELELI